MGTVVDVHCHAFNADDLPVQGFLRRVVFRNVDLAAAVAVMLDRITQAGAPGYDAEIRRLDSLLGSRAAFGLETLSGAEELPDLDLAVEAVLQDLHDNDPALVQELDQLMPSASVEKEGVLSLAGGAARAVRWGLLLGSFRVDIAARMIETFDDVDLYTPMLVDLGLGVNDREAASIQQQMVLHEKVSRLSMLDQLPGSTRGVRVHPFIGFDPRRHARSKQNRDIESALDLVVLAVEKYGFIGVKLYPPMGFRPIDNAPIQLDRVTAMSAQEAGEADEALRELYRYCSEQDVPITAHCNFSNGAHASYYGFSDPLSWAKVLEEFPDLRLNLGHFGGAATHRDRKQSQVNDWPDRIAALAQDDNLLFADVGNHRIEDADVATAYLRRLDYLFTKHPVMKRRLMYGSDWSMLALLPETKQFRRRYEELFRDQFGDDATERFMGAAALEFLGFSPQAVSSTPDQENQNAKRLRERYTRHQAARPAWLPAHPLSDPTG